MRYRQEESRWKEPAQESLHGANRNEDRSGRVHVPDPMQADVLHQSDQVVDKGGIPDFLAEDQQRK